MKPCYVTTDHKYTVYIYIYIYVCVCVCVCVDTRTLSFQVIVTMMHNVIPLQNQSPIHVIMN